MNILLGIIFLLAGFLLGFGDGGRGRYSRHISTVAGLIWLGAVIYSFIYGGWKYGLIAIFASFIIAGITYNVGKNTVAKLRN